MARTARKRSDRMKVKRAASIPLILHDPYFSIWSGTDKLYDSDTVHWCGKRQKIRGYITIDGESFCFMGAYGNRDKIYL